MDKWKIIRFVPHRQYFTSADEPITMYIIAGTENKACLDTKKSFLQYIHRIVTGCVTFNNFDALNKVDSQAEVSLLTEREIFYAFGIKDISCEENGLNRFYFKLFLPKSSDALKIKQFLQPELFPKPEIVIKYIYRGATIGLILGYLFYLLNCHLTRSDENMHIIIPLFVLFGCVHGWSAKLRETSFR